ncbi:hypothetical protein GJAV_G00090510 [Gymnothorax javanicus]|nr:hypothetical protein GJAV_G00090510 [Gymnothorax javanicus]
MSWTYNYPERTFIHYFLGHFLQAAIMGTQRLAPGPATRTIKFMIMTVFPILILFLTFYFFGTQYWTMPMALLEPLYPANMKLNNEPKEIPLSEMSADDIKHLIWNELPETGNFRSVSGSSSGQHSVVSLEQPRAQYCVGDTLTVLVNLKDYRGIPKAYGGDFILARIHSPELQASASGEVTDLRNGSYRVRFRLFWPGVVQVSVLLMHSSEAVGILKRISENNYNKIIYTGFFFNGTKKEASQCGVRLKVDQALCEYGKKEDAEYYACIRPKTLPCSALKTMSSRNNPVQDLTKNEQSLLTRDHTGIQIKNSFDPVNVVTCPGQETIEPREKCVVGFGMMSPSPSGYFFKNRWASTSCQNGNLFSANAISKCLMGKTLKLMGDSTVRQWKESVRDSFEGLKSAKQNDLPNLTQTQTSEGNISIQFHGHGHPFVSSRVQVLERSRYVSRELDGVEAGDVVVIGVGQHFRPFPLELFIQRLINIRKAILRLQEHSPQTLVVIKVENTRELSSAIVQLSDWFGYLHNMAQRKVFRDLKVVLIDAWDMTTAANTLAIHPNRNIVSNEISLALSYLCQNV